MISRFNILSLLVFWLFSLVYMSFTTNGYANDLSFEDAQVRTAYAREQMERKKKQLDVSMQELDAARKKLNMLKQKLNLADSDVKAAESVAKNLEKEYEVLQKNWAEEAKRLKEIHRQERQ